MMPTSGNEQMQKEGVLVGVKIVCGETGVWLDFLQCQTERHYRSLFDTQQSQAEWMIGVTLA